MSAQFLTRTVDVRSFIFDWPTDRRSNEAVSTISVVLVNQRPTLDLATSSCVNLNLTTNYLPLTPTTGLVAVNSLISLASVRICVCQGDVENIKLP